MTNRGNFNFRNTMAYTQATILAVISLLRETVALECPVPTDSTPQQCTRTCCNHDCCDAECCNAMCCFEHDAKAFLKNNFYAIPICVCLLFVIVLIWQNRNGPFLRKIFRKCRGQETQVVPVNQPQTVKVSNQSNSNTSSNSCRSSDVGIDRMNVPGARPPLKRPPIYFREMEDRS